MKLFALLLTVAMTYGVVGVVTEPPTRETPPGRGRIGGMGTNV
jgi:hypothetical protein